MIKNKVLNSVKGFILGVSIAILFYLGSSYWQEINLNKYSDLNNSVTSYALAVEKAAPAVVNIYSDKIHPRDNKRRGSSLFGNTKLTESSLGSGVVFSSDGYILTNLHVIGNKSINVTVELNDGRGFEAALIGVDEGTDLALLKIEDNNQHFPSIEIENSENLKIGDVVLAIGNPYGLGQSVSMGIVSATGREYDNPYSNYIQTDASINKGNSGGALIDTKGRLIGINTIIRSSSGGSEGIGLAIPSSVLLNVINDLIRFGEVKRGWLGFNIEKIALLQDNTLLISKVIKNSPADKGGLLKNDIIKYINDDEASYDLLFKEFARSKPGTEINLRVLRGTKEVSLIITAVNKD